MPELPRLYYFADPMCSWCYGFAPVMDKLRKAFGAQFDIRLVMGGLKARQARRTHDARARAAHAPALARGRENDRATV
jgi:putative protein-disulfide isomerase